VTRPVTPQESGGFDGALVRAARVLAASGFQGDERDYIRSSVEHELGLVLAQLDRLGAQRRDTHGRLVGVECDLGSELLQMDAVRWWYLDSRLERWRDRQQLKARLVSARAEWARTEAAFEQQLRGLEDRLLTLVHRLGAVGAAR